MTIQGTADSLGFAMDWPATAISHARRRAREEYASQRDDVDVTKDERSVRLVIVESGVNAIDLRSTVEGSPNDALVLGQSVDESPGSFAVRVLRRLSCLHPDSKIERADMLVGPKSGRALRQARTLLARALACDLAVSDLVFRTGGEAEPEVQDELIELVEAILESPECASLRISIRVSGANR
jgi:hypothetical protein